ncbi:MAG TPA: WD40 repeat domain-containing protein, partial [Gemmataceae bacterium]|nr:WD40 repeat domain-containing protein [Gemmataceae bacterium]
MNMVISPVDRVQFGEPLWHADGDLLALAYAADGTLWSVEEPGVVRQWDGDGRLLARRTLGETETLWAFGPRAELLVSASDDLVIWDLAKGCEPITLPQASWVTAVAFHPTRRVIATGHDDGSVRLWHLTGDTGTAAEFLHHEQPVSALAFHGDGSVLATASEDHQIAVWDVQTGQLRRAFVGHTDRIPALAWQPGSNILLSAGWDTTVRVWDIDTGEPTMLLNTHSDQVHAMAFNPNGGLLAVADSSGAVRIWGEIGRGKELRVLS